METELDSVRKAILAAVNCTKPATWQALQLIDGNAVYFCAEHKPEGAFHQQRHRVCGKSTAVDEDWSQ